MKHYTSKQILIILEYDTDCHAKSMEEKYSWALGMY
jgi:hypothetical protein